MSKSISVSAIGGFFIGIVGLATALVMFFGGGYLVSDSQKFEMVFKTSISGLRVGAPVAIKGVNIGEVVDIRVKLDSDDVTVYNHVIASIRPEALFREKSGSDIDDDTLLQEMLANGLGAQLKSQSLLTGLLYINVDFFGDANPPRLVDVNTDYPQFPTVWSDLEEIYNIFEEINVELMAAQVHSLLGSLNDLFNQPETQQLPATLASAARSLETLAVSSQKDISAISKSLQPIGREGEQLLSTLNRDLPNLLEDLGETSASLQQAALKLEHMAEDGSYLLSDDSPLIYQMSQAAQAMRRAADQVNRISGTLEREPEAILKGKRAP